MAMKMISLIIATVNYKHSKNIPSYIKINIYSMKLLILIIYSDEPEYQKMLQIQRSYLHKYPNVYSFFVSFRESQEDPIMVQDDFIYVKGKEGYLHITYKTIEALDVALQMYPDVNFVIRSNISTVLNIPALLDHCANLPKHNVYTGGRMNNLQWLDPKSGIHDETLWNTHYASGTSIILSNDVAKHMVQNKDNIRHDIVDDVSIGIYIKDYLPDSYYDKCPLFLENINEKDNVDSRGVFFRNRTENRDLDADQMEMITSLLYSKGLSVGIEEGFSTIDYHYNMQNWVIIGLFLFLLFIFITCFFQKVQKNTVKKEILWILVVFFGVFFLYEIYNTI